MQDIYEKILREGYGLKYYSGTRTRTGLICKTDHGLRELKKARTNKQKILFAHTVKRCLYRNGFSALCLFHTAQDGQPFFLWDGICYTLEDVMPGKSLDTETAQDWLDGAKLMGNMHHAAQGLTISEDFAQAEQLPLLWEKRTTELVKIKRHMEKQGKYSPLDLLVLQYYAPFYERAKQANAALQAEGYATFCKTQQKNGVFCHNQLKGSNFYRHPDNSLWIGGFEHCTADIFLLDVVYYIKRLWRKTNGDQKLVAQVLETYEKERPMTETEHRLLLPLTAYPEKFLQLVHEDYNKRRVCVSPAMQQHLAQTAEEEMQIGELETFLQEYFT